MINGEGFYSGPDWVWDAKSNLTINERAVMTVLYRWTTGDSGIVQRSKGQIASDAGIKSKQTLNKALRSLVTGKVIIFGQEVSMLEIVPKSSNGKDLCTEYRLPPLHKRASAKIDHKPTKKGDKLGGQEMTPPENEGSGDDPPRGSGDDPTGLQGTEETTIPEGGGVDIISEMKKIDLKGPGALKLFTKYRYDRCKHNLDWFIAAREAAKRLGQKKPGIGLLVTGIRHDYSALRWESFIEDMEKKAIKKIDKNTDVLHVVRAYKHVFDGKYFVEPGEYIGLFFQISLTVFLKYDDQIESLENYNKFVKAKSIIIIDNDERIYKFEKHLDVYFVGGVKDRVEKFESALL